MQGRRARPGSSCERNDRVMHNKQYVFPFENRLTLDNKLNIIRNMDGLTATNSTIQHGRTLILRLPPLLSLLFFFALPSSTSLLSTRHLPAGEKISVCILRSGNQTPSRILRNEKAPPGIHFPQKLPQSSFESSPSSMQYRFIPVELGPIPRFYSCIHRFRIQDP